MSKIKKPVLFILAGIICLGIILFIINIINNNTYRKQIPASPDLTNLSDPIKEQLLQARKKANDNPSPENIGMLGLTYHSDAFYDQAKQCYQLAIKRDKSEWKWNYYLGYLNQEMGDSKASIENFKSVIEINPKAYFAWYYLGNAYQSETSIEKAEEAYNKIAYLQGEVDNARTVRVNYSSLPVIARFELARIYMNTNRLDEAEKLLNEVVQKNHTIGPVYRLLGNVLSAKGDLVLSKKYIVRAQDLAEVTTLNDTLIDRISLMSRSELYLPKQIDNALKSANPEWALQLFNQALLYLPNDKYLVSKAIKYFLRMNTGQEALPYLEKNLRDFKDDFNEMGQVAELLFKNEFYSQALPYFSQIEKLKPEFIDLKESYALSYWKLGRKDSALNMMNNLYEKNLNNPKVLASVVDFMIKIGDKEKAKSILAKFRQLAPSDPKISKLSAIIADMEGNHDAAISLYEAAFKGDPSDLETTQKLGNLLLEKKDWSESINMMGRALEQHPNEPFLLERLGALLVSCPDSKLRNNKEGLELSERAFYHISSNSNTLLSAGTNLAQGYAMNKDFQTAIYYITITVNMAQSNKVSEKQMQGLLKLASKIKHFSEKQNTLVNPNQ